MKRLVVVGASLAGLRAAQAARLAGFTGELVVVGDEEHPPYTRPPLSKQLLAGEQEPADCGLGHGAVEATWRLGCAAVGLDRGKRVVRLADGDAVAYDRVIVATGARARPWPGPGAELEGVFALRGIDDALALRAALTASPRPRVVCVGAGFIGCEVAATARGLGCEVTLVDVAQQPLMSVGPELGARCAALHAEHGVVLRLGVGVEALEGTDRVTGVVLVDGSTIPADIVVVALGALPNVEWLAGSGLELDRGLACETTLTSVSDPDVLGAGDAISWPHPLAGERVRVEHWTVAAEHGALAGRNVLLDAAERVAHVSPPYVWSDQYDLKLQCVGFPARAQGGLEVFEEEGGRLVAAGFQGGRLVGAVGFTAARRIAFYRLQLADPPTELELRERVAADPKRLGAPVPA